MTTVSRRTPAWHDSKDCLSDNGVRFADRSDAAAAGPPPVRARSAQTLTPSCHTSHVEDAPLIGADAAEKTL